MKIHDLQPAPGSNKRSKRVGRGIGGKGGKTAGRGTKGQGARDTIPMGFEGGQMPLQRRIPKLKGFNNPFRVEYVAMNLDTIQELDVDAISPESLTESGHLHKGELLKVLGRGSISRAVAVKAHACSASAKQAIVSAGGSVEIVPPPFGNGRPPAKGNALTNR